MPGTPQVILITGTSSGFGRDSAIALARKGHTVYASMRAIAGKNKANADELTRLAASENLKLKVVELDVTDETQATAAVERVIDDAGRLDVLVNNAGYAAMGITEAFTLDQVRAMYETNVFGPIALVRAVLPQMREQKRGLLVHVTSGIGRFTAPGMGVYASTKWALEAIGETLRYEGAPIGVDSVMVEPGAFKTELFGKMPEAADTERSGGYGPLADVAGGFEGGLNQYFESDAYRGPEIVTEAIVDLIESEDGSRPARVAVGADMEAVRQLNAAAQPHQRALLEAFGFADFAAKA